MERDNPSFQDAFTHKIAIRDTFTHQIWNFYLKEYKKRAPDTIILKTRSEVKVNVTGTQRWCATLCHLKMHPNTKFGIPPNTKFGIPSLNNIGDMVPTRVF